MIFPELHYRYYEHQLTIEGFQRNDKVWFCPKHLELSSGEFYNRMIDLTLPPFEATFVGWVPDDQELRRAYEELEKREDAYQRMWQEAC